MILDPIFKQLTPDNVSLDDLYLDPNNPRFRGYDWSYVSDEAIAVPEYQKEAERLLLKHFDVEKLVDNMEVNGYLPIDRVVIRQFAQSKYVVLEGNRRICAAKLLQKKVAAQLFDLGEVGQSVASIPCLVYTGTDQDAAWIFQGLRHISGIIEWSAFNKASLLVEQMEKDNTTVADVARRFGLSSYGANQWIRGLRAYQQACSRSDYTRELDERAYPYFQELFGRSSGPVRDWMKWDDQSKRFLDELALNEFVGWLYPRSQDPDEDRRREYGFAEPKGDWERRRLDTRDDVRKLAYLIREAPDFFMQFRQEGNLESSYSKAISNKYTQDAKSTADRSEETLDAIVACTKALDDLPIKLVRDAQLRERLSTALKGLSAALNEAMSDASRI